MTYPLNTPQIWVIHHSEVLSDIVIYSCITITVIEWYRIQHMLNNSTHRSVFMSLSYHRFPRLFIGATGFGTAIRGWWQAEPLTTGAWSGRACHWATASLCIPRPWGGLFHCSKFFRVLSFNHTDLIDDRLFLTQLPHGLIFFFFSPFSFPLFLRCLAV